jgi:hypothetical protein
MVDLLAGRWRPGLPTSSASSPVSLAAALAITASGVFTAWARLPAWLRARSTNSALRTSSELSSSTTGWTSPDAGRPALPVRRRAAGSVHRAGVERTQAGHHLDDGAPARPAASSPRAVSSMPRKRARGSASRVSSAATIRRSVNPGCSGRAHDLFDQRSASPFGAADAMFVPLAIGRTVAGHGQFAVPQASVSAAGDGCAGRRRRRCGRPASTGRNRGVPGAGR